MEDVEKFKKLGSMFVSKRSEAGLILSIPFAVACNPVIGLGVKYISTYKGQGLTGSGALDSALRSPDMASTSSRRRDVGDL